MENKLYKWEDISVIEENKEKGQYKTRTKVSRREKVFRNAR